MKQDPSLRLLLFSANEAPINQFTKLDISFPSQIEVKINGDEVKANYKGLKNKPGSTRPVDITDFVRISPANYRNNILVTYALTQKVSQSSIPSLNTRILSMLRSAANLAFFFAKQKFNLFVYMVKKFSIEDLTKRIKQRNVITRQSVLNESM